MEDAESSSAAALLSPAEMLVPEEIRGLMVPIDPWRATPSVVRGAMVRAPESKVTIPICATFGASPHCSTIDSANALDSAA